jgi:hypothetical protein
MHAPTSAISRVTFVELFLLLVTSYLWVPISCNLIRLSSPFAVDAACAAAAARDLRDLDPDPFGIGLLLTTNRLRDYPNIQFLSPLNGNPNAAQLHIYWASIIIRCPSL